MKTTPDSKSVGFTLIELLTVIAIIGILAAILIPTVGAVRKKAANASDASNLRQMATALQQFANDNKGSFPTDKISVPYTNTGPSLPDRCSFIESLDRYFSDRYKKNRASIYNYLANPMWNSKFAEPWPTYANLDSYNQTAPIAYLCNPYAYRASLYPQWAGKTGVIPAPSRYVIIGEVNQQAPGETTTMDVTNPATTQSGVMSGYRVNRDGKALYVFCDGHVASLEGDLSEAALQRANKPSIWRWW